MKTALMKAKYKGLPTKEKDNMSINVLHAAAIQDHYSKALLGNNPFPKIAPIYSQIKHQKLQSRNQQFNQLGQNILSNIKSVDELRRHGDLLIQQIRNENMPNSNSKHTINNLLGQNLQQKQMPKINKKPSLHQTLFQQSIQNCSDKEQREDKIKWDKYYQSLSLAQRLGIVACPPKPLDNAQWHIIEEMSKKRSDCEGVCPICLDEFKLDNQIILSCSHVFHQKCLESFERYSNQAQGHKKCPICRRKNYEVRSFSEGATIYQNKSAIKIQSLAKGHLCRKRFFEVLLLHSKPQTNLLKRRLMAYKLKKISHKARIRQQKINVKTDNYLTFLDKESQISNQYLSQQLQKIKQNYEINQQQLQIVLQNEQNYKDRQEFRDHIDSELSKCVQKNCLQKGEIDWQEVKETALKKHSDDNCAICFNKIFNGKPNYLLDCCHVFHAQCLSSFEHYNTNVKVLCPICRHEYQKRQLFDVKNVVNKDTTKIQNAIQTGQSTNQIINNAKPNNKAQLQKIFKT